ncbi:MAG: GtrA family protein [Chitinophagaceae bacterium]
MNLQTFRYAAAGGSNMVLGFILYSVFYQYVLVEQDLDLGFYALKSHSAALFISFLFTFPIGFFLAKYVVFSDSRIPGWVQLFRYLMICLFNLALNYILLKILVEIFHIHPIFAQVLTSSVVITVSYLAQRHFSFKSTGIMDETTTD